MHTCNFYCSGAEHIETSYSIEIKSRLESMIQQYVSALENFNLEVYNKPIKVLHLKEIYEFSREEAKERLYSNSIDLITLNLKGYKVRPDDKIRAFRYTFIYT